MKQSNCSKKSTPSDGRGAETLAAAAMQQGDRDIVVTVPIVNGRYITCQTIVTSWKRMPADVWQEGAAACDEVVLLVEI